MSLPPALTQADRRRVKRREEDRAAAEAPKAPPERSPRPQGVYAAQLLGQAGQKRGLRGGPAVLEAAKTAYLETEYSGPSDRRPPKGRLGAKAI